MPRTCFVCSSPERMAIDNALLAGESLRNIAKRVSISPAGLLRHKSHVCQPIVKAGERREERLSESLLDEMRDVAEGVGTACADVRLASLRITEITGKHASQFAARNSTLRASAINCGLWTLRRALNLAFEWGKLDKPVRVPGERRRDRVLSDAEIKLYFDNCRQPWKDAATLILGTGMHPGEVYGLRWEFLLLNGSGGLIQVSEGKSKAARRILPIIPDVYRILKDRHEAQGKPDAGWVFPSTARYGHLEQNTAKTKHSAAIAR